MSFSRISAHFASGTPVAFIARFHNATLIDFVPAMKLTDSMSHPFRCNTFLAARTRSVYCSVALLSQSRAYVCRRSDVRLNSSVRIFFCVLLIARV